ncbi:unnamed protein product [Cylindrotheca closterium]|uniref:Ion transport domain-containing protein n=1 Tax=Cylindrotheca closterium TaxID=2856 RepID=A0AAD2CGM4_9STRA|nr:unnamed protein product [Cylindrotheca closterium]
MNPSRFSKSRSYQKIFTPPPGTRYPNHRQQELSPERQTPNSKVSGNSDYQSTMQQANDDCNTTTTTPPLRAGMKRESIPLYAMHSTRTIQNAIMVPNSPGSSASESDQDEKQPLKERIKNLHPATGTDTDNIIYEMTSDSMTSPQSRHPQNIFRDRTFNDSTEDDASPSSSRRLDPNQRDENDPPRTNSKIHMAPSSSSGTTTKLHRLCQNMLTFGDILLAKSILSSEDAYNDKNSASIKDDRGATPLHVFARNKALAAKVCPYHGESSKGFSKLYPQSSSFDTLEAESNLKKEIVKFLVHDLLAASPKATVQVNNEGFIPFQAGIADWVHTCQNNVRNAASRKTGRHTTTMGQVWESTSTTLTNAMKLAQGKATGGSQAKLSLEDLEQGQGLQAGVPSVSNNTSENHHETREVGNLVALSEHARFIFIMLSAIIDRLEMHDSSRQASSPRFGNSFSNQGGFERTGRMNIRGLKRIEGASEIAATIIEEVASIPGLMETLLLIEDDSERDFAISQTIILRVMASRRTIGVWLTGMLQSDDRKVAFRAVDYLKTASIECAKNSTSTLQGSTGPRVQDCAGHMPLVDELSNLQDFIPALLALGDQGMEEASTTLIVKGALDRLISKPFSVTVILCDVIFLVIMILGFRSSVRNLISGRDLGNVLWWIYVANIGIFYFIMREIGKLFSLLSIAKRARRYFLSFWNLIDFLATFLALISTVAMRWHFALDNRGLDDFGMLRKLLAVTTGFLWLRVLSLLKAINMQLATFVLAIIQITKDILWFCVILVTLVISFAQMFFTVLAPASCATDNTDNMQCKESDYLLRVYTILLGDFGNFDLDSFQSGFPVFLLVLFSFLVTVVLLNVLIAIASDSYEKCLIRSQHLFGRARIMLVAELVSFQNLLKRADQNNDQRLDLLPLVYSVWWTRSSVFEHWSRSSVLFFCVSGSVTLVWTLAELWGYSSGDHHGSVMLCLSSVIVNGLLFMMIMTFLKKAASKTNAIKGDADREADGFTDGYIQQAMLHVLGTSQKLNRDQKSKRGNFNDWSGRVNYLQKEMMRISKEQELRSQEHMRAIENCITLSETRLRMEINELHDRMGNLTQGGTVEGVDDDRQYDC